MLKIKVMPLVFMFLASALIIPIGISYAAYDDSPSFTTVPTTTNETDTNMTMPTTNETDTNMTMPTTNETDTNMTMPTTNETDTNMTMPTTNETDTNMTMPTTNETDTNMTMPTTNEANTPSAPLDPLKQFDSGVSAKDIQCPADFSLVLKASDGSPACVHSSTVQILIQRGWAAIQ